MKFSKILLLITSLLILLPVLVGALTWDILPEKMATHWGASGIADDWTSRAFAVFGTPMILLLVHWVCIIITAADHKKREQNKKAYNTVLFITPLISWFTCGIMYATAFGLEFDINSVVFGLFGLMFIIIGNYMPKISQNRTLGIKIPSTLESEANWNATHRFAGKVWVLVGVISLFCILLPHNISMIVMPLPILAAVLIPVIYSYKFRQKEIKEGKKLMKFKKNKKAIIICSVILGVILLGLGFIMFSGNVEISYGEDSFTLDSMYASPLTIKYSDISGVWYTEDYIEGDKVNGFNSARLMVGKYENEALGTYDRYTYTGNNAFVVAETTDKEGKLHYTVIGGNSFSETKEIYNTLSADYGFDITYQEDSFTITPSHGEAVIVKHSQVGSTQYRPEYIDGEKKSGFETNEIMMGEYQNDEYGKYKRFSYYDTDAYIIIEILENGETVDYVVFNEDSIEKTSALYDELSEKVVG